MCVCEKREPSQKVTVQLISFEISQGNEAFSAADDVKKRFADALWSVNDAPDKKTEEVAHWEHSKEVRTREAGGRRKEGKENNGRIREWLKWKWECVAKKKDMEVLLRNTHTWLKQSV